MFRNSGIFSSEDKNFSWWWLGIKIGLIAGLIVWWWLENQNKKLVKETASQSPLNNLKSIPLPIEGASSDKTTEVEPSDSSVEHLTELDDLTKVEGIGPKINSTLQEAGLHTFDQLAASNPAALKQILLDAGIRIGYPDTWPEQAALAAKANWTELEVFQSGLQGGRRVAS